MKRFHSRRNWHNTKLTLWVIPFVLLVGVIYFAASGKVLLMQVLVAVSILALTVALVRDMSDRGNYYLHEDELVLESLKDRVVIPLMDILDVSLIDRAAAREYILGSLRSEGVEGYFRIHRGSKRFLRYASIDIGFRTFTMGVGRRLIDRMPDARQDLVLLRLRNGDAYFLSPLYNQELVSVIARRTLAVK